MSLSNSVKTHLIDPAVHNNSRTEFRLDDAFWASSMRLVDLGMYNPNCATDTGLYYPSILGVMAAVKKLTLYSGGTIIDEIQELPSWASIQHLRTSNQGSEDINRFELLNGMGLQLTSEDNWSFDADTDYKQLYGNNNQARLHNQFQIAAESDDQTSGAVSLADYLGLLKSNPVLPKIPELRLIVDWNRTASDYVADDDAPNNPVGAQTYTPIRPTLIADELVGVPEGQAQDFKLPFLANIVERHVVAAADAGAAVGDAKRQSFRSSAFRNRYVKDLTFFNKVTTDDGWMTAKQRSPCQRGEVLQLVVNGQKYLPDQGIDQEAQKLQYFNDTMGSLNLPAPAFYESLTDTSGRVLATGDRSQPSNQLVGNFSVTSVRVEDNIDRLDVEYTRQKTGTAGKDAAFTLLCFGRCAKQLEVRNGQVRISY